MRPRASSTRTWAGRWLAAVLAALAAGCVVLPSQEGRPESAALADTQHTRLGAAVAPLAAAHPGETGIHALTEGPDAFAARVLLAAAAERSIDAQYYIWHPDETGLLLLEALSQAARRGVRVRLLLDDQNTRGMDAILAAFAALPGAQLRLYNPFAHRSARLLDYVADFTRVNRRMHNKAFIADNQVAVVGGRNIGNEYFGAGGAVPFLDLDVVAIGAAVAEVSAEFDLYWRSASAYPAQRLVGRADAAMQEALAARFAAVHADPDSRSYVRALRETALVGQLLDRRLPFEWAAARLVRDDPAKTLDRESRTDVLMLSAVLAGESRAQRSLDIISPYFVPGERGAEFLEDLARGGVRIRVLTNSLAATDVAVVHSGYAKRRCRLARAGVRLFELKPVAEGRQRKDKPDSMSSAARLHAKTFAADGERIFVGSFNFDPRSALLNTEMGLVIRSATLARRLGASLDEAAPLVAYEVRPREGEPCIEWIERSAAGEVRHAAEPATGWGRRAWMGFLEALPLDWLL